MPPWLAITLLVLVVLGVVAAAGAASDTFRPWRGVWEGLKEYSSMWLLYAAVVVAGLVIWLGVEATWRAFFG